MPRAGIFASGRVASGGGITATFQQSAIDATDATTYTFTSQPIGTASATRRVVVGIGYRQTTSIAISSVTIGGITATIDASAGTTNRSYIASAVVPTGTTATVVVTVASTVARCGIGVWTLTNGSPTGQSAATGTHPASLTVTTNTGDVVIACGIENGTTGSTASWSGATERYDETVEGDISQSGADTVASGSSTGITLTWSATSGTAASAAAYA